MSSFILIVEDNIELAQALESRIRDEGYETLVATNISQAKEHVQSHEVLLALLDVNLTLLTESELLESSRSIFESQAGEEGFELAIWLSKNYPDMRIIFLTDLSGVQSRIKGLNFGADDYLTKPVHAEELLARIGAGLRRVKKLTPKKEIVGRWLYDLTMNELTHLDNKEMKAVRLAFSESKVFSEIIKAQGGVVSRETLSKRAFGRPLTPGDRAVDTTISKLRTKIDDGRSNRNSLIETVHGEGYRLKRT